MSQIKPPLPTSNPFSTWATSVRNVVRETTLNRSSGMLMNTSPYGTYIAPFNEEKYPSLFMNYSGEYDPIINYNLMDVVRVLPGKTYDLPWDASPTKTTGNNPSISGYINGQLLTLPNFIPVPGTYICVVPIPGLLFSIEIINSFSPGGIYANSGASLSSLSLGLRENINYLRFFNINYYPVWPEMPNLAVLKGRYWELLSLLPITAQFCEDGKTVSSFVDSQPFPTGSANYTGSV